MHESKGHILAKLHPYIFFTLQLDSILESWICPIHAVINAVHVLHTDYYDQSAIHSSSGLARLYQSMYKVPQTYDSVINVHGMVLASSPGHFLPPTWPTSEF